MSLLRSRIIKPVLANRQKARVQCSNCVIAWASHDQTCSWQSPESPSCNVPLVSLLRPRISNLFLPIARKPSCNVPFVTLLRRRINKPVLANRQKALVQCSNRVIATASHKQACSCQSPESPSCNVPNVSLLRPHRNKAVLLPIARKPSCNVPIVSLLRPTHNQTCSCQSPESPSCNVQIVSLLLPRRNKPVFANRQKALMQCSNRVIAMVSHEKSCTCQSTEKPSCNANCVIA